MGFPVLGLAQGAADAIERVVEERGDKEVEGCKGQGVKGLI